MIDAEPAGDPLSLVEVAPVEQDLGRGGEQQL